MADFSSIRFLPKRPLLRELSADRLNSILAEIRRNKPLPGRGITVRQTGQGTAIDLAASIPRGGSAPAPLRPWDLVVTGSQDEETALVSVIPGTLNGFLADNWNNEGEAKDVPLSKTGTHFAKAIVTTDGREMTGLSITIHGSAPTTQAPEEFGIASTIELVFGIFADGAPFRTIGDNFNASPKLWLTTEKQTPPQPGEIPFLQYFYFG